MMVRRSRLVALVTAIACVAVAAAGLRASESAPDFEVVRARLGAPATTQDGEVTVDRVRVGTKLASRGEVTDTTVGLFVVLRVSAAATGPREQVFTDSRLLARNDRVYDSYGSSSARAAAGFVEEVDYVYEVDPNAIEDLTVEVWRSELVGGYQERVQVHLGITADNAAAWRDAGVGQVLEADLNGTTRALP